MTELCACAHCGTAEGELTEFNGRLYCPDCLDDLTLVCADCGSRFLRTHNRSENDDFPICPECYDRDYTRCVRCGRIIDTDHCWYPLDNDDPYCADCCSTIENSPIHDYYFKPYPVFYGEGPQWRCPVRPACLRMPCGRHGRAGRRYPPDVTGSPC